MTLVIGADYAQAAAFTRTLDGEARVFTAPGDLYGYTGPGLTVHVLPGFHTRADWPATAYRLTMLLGAGADVRWPSTT